MECLRCATTKNNATSPEGTYGGLPQERPRKHPQVTPQAVPDGLPQAFWWDGSRRPLSGSGESPGRSMAGLGSHRCAGVRAPAHWRPADVERKGSLRSGLRRSWSVRLAALLWRIG